jgi:hypothetical protein
MKRFEPPDQFMYRRQGPWPQPSPSYPLLCANEVLTVPELEQLQYNLDIGSRYLRDLVAFAPFAAKMAIADMAWAGPTDADLDRLMFTTEFTRFIRELDDRDRKRCKDTGVKVSQKTRKYDFSAMRLIVNRTIEGTYTAGTILIYEHDRTAGHQVTCIFLNDGDDASAGKDVCAGIWPFICRAPPTTCSWCTPRFPHGRGQCHHCPPAGDHPLLQLRCRTRYQLPLDHVGERRVPGQQQCPGHSL